MRKSFILKKTAISLSVCAATALCINLAGSCSADEDYDKYRGDELNTRAMATRSITESETIYKRNATPQTVSNAPFHFSNNKTYYGSFVYVVSATEAFDDFGISVNDNDCESDTIGTITGEVTSFTLSDSNTDEDEQVVSLTLTFSTYLEKKKSVKGTYTRQVTIPQSDFKSASLP